jgi:hypothetical protein
VLWLHTVAYPLTLHWRGVELGFASLDLPSKIGFTDADHCSSGATVGWPVVVRFSCILWACGMEATVNIIRVNKRRHITWKSFEVASPAHPSRYGFCGFNYLRHMTNEEFACLCFRYRNRSASSTCVPNIVGMCNNTSPAKGSSLQPEDTILNLPITPPRRYLGVERTLTRPCQIPARSRGTSRSRR